MFRFLTYSSVRSAFRLCYSVSSNPSAFKAPINCGLAIKTPLILNSRDSDSTCFQASYSHTRPATWGTGKKRQIPFFADHILNGCRFEYFNSIDFVVKATPFPPAPPGSVYNGVSLYLSSGRHLQRFPPRWPAPRKHSFHRTESFCIWLSHIKNILAFSAVGVELSSSQKVCSDSEPSRGCFGPSR